MRIGMSLGLACLAALSMASVGAVFSSRDNAMAALANPEDAKVGDAGLVSDYFGITFRGPEGWRQGIAGPGPSQSGYYVLGSWAPAHDASGTILVVAQDNFFSADTSDDVKDIVTHFRHVMSSVEGMTIDREPELVKIGTYSGYRLDFSGVGLFRSMLAIEIRCHVVTFNLTSRDPDMLSNLAASLVDHVVFGGKAGHLPECHKDHVAEHLTHRVEPDDAARSASIPVRMIVGKDGSVKHVHVIRASAAQRREIDQAVRQWRFKPYLKQGRPAEIETGVMFGRAATNS